MGLDTGPKIYRKHGTQPLSLNFFHAATSFLTNSILSILLFMLIFSLFFILSCNVCGSSEPTLDPK
jgi:uncharacterized membrane protein (DUF373 family)